MQLELTIKATYVIPDTAKLNYAADGTCLGFTFNPDTDSAKTVRPGFFWVIEPWLRDINNCSTYDIVSTYDISPTERIELRDISGSLKFTLPY